jgi:EAL domain-containing protein (putative c-di-GMP-specific phosphodiesterase class I)
VVYPLDGEDNSKLITNALISLEQTKNPNANNYGITGFTISPKTATLLKVENSLNIAIKEQKFFLCYQPQINIETGKLTGIEALLKWKDSDLFQLAPRHFFKLAEETDLMLPLSKWVIKTACMQMKAWVDSGLPFLPIGVNLFFRQFQELNLGKVIKEILEESSLPPELLELEIPENCFMQNPELVYQTIADLTKMGVKICWDLFGEGNLSISYLEKFNFNSLKISKKLIMELNNNPRTNALISSIITLSNGFDVRIVAEGVETLQQMELLRSLNCHQIQGNLFSRPLGTQQTANFLKRDDHKIT